MTRTAHGQVVVGVLGPTVVGVPPEVAVPARREARLLAGLALAGADGLGVEQVVVLPWPDGAPGQSRQALHTLVGRARALVGREALAWDGQRYRLDPAIVSLDADRLVQDLADTEAAAVAQDPATALQRAEAGLALWRGEPYADLDDHLGAEAARARLEQVRADLQGLRAAALLDLGRVATAVVELQRLVEQDPHRESWWTLLVSGLHRAGRRADALDAYRQARDVLARDLGLEPGGQLRRAQRRVLQARPDAVPPPRPGAAELVGRDTLVAGVVEALTPGGRVLLHGPAGIGKSTVAGAATLALRAAGRRVVALDGASSSRLALGPIRELLAALRDDLDRLAPPAPRVVRALAGPAPAAPRLDDPARGPQRDTPDLVAAVAGAVGRVAADRPGLSLVVDDADTCGPTTRRVLAALAATDDVSLLLLARRREEVADVLPDDVVAHALTGLDEDAVRALVVRRLGTDHGVDALARWLARVTGGNPLFVGELLDDLRRRGALRAQDGAIRPPRDLDVPPRLVEVVGQRVAALGLAARRALDVVAVAGPGADPDVLAVVTDLDPLAEAVAAGVLHPRADGGLAFSHELLQRAALDLVPAGRRLELHEALATALQARRAPAPEIARHRLRALDVDPLAAADACMRAGASLLVEQAHEEAAAWFDHAADALAAGGVTDPARRLAPRVEAADARRLAGLPGHADALLDCAEEALQVGGPDLERRAALAALALGETSEAGPAQRRVSALADRVLARATDPVTLATVGAAASMAHSMVGNPGRCRRLFTDAVDELDRVPLVARAETAVLVLPYAYLALAHPDDLEAREQAAAQLHQAADELDDGPAAFEAWHLTFSAALQRGDGVAVREALAGATALQDRVGDAGRRWSLAYMQAAVAALDARFRDAEEANERALAIGSGVAAGRALAAFAGQLLELRRLEGRLDELAPLLQQLLDEQPVLPAWGAAGALVLAGPDPDRATALFDDLARDRFAALPRDFAWLAGVQTLGRAAVALGDPDRAGRVADVLAPYADRVTWQGTCAYGPVAATLGDLDRVQECTDRARVHARRALALARALQAPGYVQEAELLLSRLG